MDGEESAGQDAGCGQESESRKEVEALAQQQAVRKHSIATVSVDGSAGY
jgi:hypothetical protein